MVPGQEDALGRIVQTDVVRGVAGRVQHEPVAPRQAQHVFVIDQVRVRGNEKVNGAFFDRHFEAIAGNPYSPNSANAEVEELPEDAFKGVEAFRQTGVRTKLVMLTRRLPTPDAV